MPPRPRRRPGIRPSALCKRSILYRLRSADGSTLAEDRAAVARRPRFPSNLHSRTHPGFRSIHTEAGRVKRSDMHAPFTIRDLGRPAMDECLHQGRKIHACTCEKCGEQIG